MEPSPLVRPRSFVIRGRKTEAQQRAIDEHWGEFGIDFDGARLDLDAIFGRSGIEVHGAGVGRVLAAAHEQGLTNVRVVRHDAVEVFEQGLAADSVDEVLIFFPDPWPKARHHRRRLVQPDVVRLLVGALKPTGVLRLATDWEPYAEHMIDVLDAEPALVNVAGPGGFIPRPDERPVTKFERRGERLGHAIFDLEYRPRG